MENLTKHVETIREALQEAQREQLVGSSAAMESLRILNTKILEMEEDMAVLQGQVAHG